METTDSPKRLMVEDVEPREVEGQSFLVDSLGYSYPCRFTSAPGSRLLYVVVHGAADGATCHFGRWNWTRFLHGNVLAVCDPTLYLNGRNSSGWYDTKRDADAIPGLAKLAQTFAARLGMVFSQIVFYGVCADGFAALLAAARCSAGCLAVDPVTVTESSLPPARRNAAEAFLAARRSGHFPRAVIVQNQQEEGGCDTQYLSFCKALNVPGEGGIGFHGAVKSIPYNENGSAGSATADEAIKRITLRAIPFLTKRHYTTVSEIEPAEVEGQAFAVECQGLTFPCRYIPYPGSDLLYVGLHAAVNRQKDALPLYARWNWSKILRGSILSIDDPTLYLDDKLRLGWYIGTRDRDGIKGLVEIAKAIAGRLGIPSSRIVFYGTSGGGYASIMAAAEGSAACVAINPQIDVALYNAAAVAEFAQVFDAAATPAASRAAFPTRWSAIEAMDAARKAGRSPKVFIIQNTTNDEYTFNGHYLPFCNAFGVPGEGGIGCDGSVMSGTYSDEAGHDAADTPEVVRRILSEALPFFAALEKGDSQVHTETKAAVENATTEKATSEKAATEKAATEKAATEKAATEKAALEDAALHKAAGTIFHYSDVSALNAEKIAGQLFTVDCEGFRFPCRYTPYSGSRVLYVTLHGAVERETQQLPVFARWNWSKILRGNVLAVCDPTLFLDEKISVGWYVGTKEKDVIPGLTRIAQVVASQLGLLPNQIIFYGSSGGGFAATVAAATCSASCVAINPQTDISKHLPVVVAELTKVFDPTASPAESRAAFPTRWSSSEAIKVARQDGRSPRVLIVQNLIDTYTHREHFLPFCEALGVPHAGGIGCDNSVKSMIYSHEDGHSAADTPEVLRAILSDGLPFLLNGATA